MKRLGLALAFCALLSLGGAQAQLAGGLMFPGPGTPHSTGGGGFSITANTPVTTGHAVTTYPNVTVGSPCNVVLIGILYGSTAATTGITAVSLNSVTASPVSGAAAINVANGTGSDMWFVTGVTGSSLPLSITYSGALTGGSMVQTWCVVTTTPTPSAGANGNAGGTVPTSVNASITISAGGGAVGVCYDNDTFTPNWTNLTTDNSPTWAGQFVTVNGVTGHTTSASGSTSITCGTASSAGPYVMSLAAISP